MNLMENTCQILLKRRALSYARRKLRLRPNERLSVKIRNKIKSFLKPIQPVVVIPPTRRIGRTEGPLVSIIIPVYNKLELTQLCLKAISANTEYLNYEIIVVDNASSDGTTEFLKQLANDKIKPLFCAENRGFGDACNEGATVAKGSYLLFLNNDTEPQPGWLSSLVDLAEARPECGAVGSKLVYPDGRLQEAGGIVFSDGNAWNYGRGQNPNFEAFNFVREVDYCSGASLLVRRSLWDAVGGFDGRYAPAYYEDTDLCFAARKQGFKVYYQPKSVVIHHEGQTAGTELQSGCKRFQIENHTKFLEKWSKELLSQCKNDPTNVFKASGRSAEKSILVVEPLLPHFDRASGSKRIFLILGLLKELNCHVTFIARNPQLEENYKPILENMGIEVYAGDPAAMKAAESHLENVPPINYQALLQTHKFDYAIIGFWDITMHYLPIIRRFSPSTCIIVNTVDVHFLREIREAELKGSDELMKEAQYRKFWEISVYRLADRLWVVTPKDKEVLEEYIQDVPIDVVPNIHAVSESIQEYERTSDLLFIGNFNHPPNLDAVLNFHERIFPQIISEEPDIQLYIVGNNPPPEVCELASERVIVTGYVEDLAPYLESARISINPLRFGAGMKGKIGEALSFGVPVVSTTVGAEGMGLEDGVDALIADSDADFAQAVLRLYRDKELWARLARNGKARVSEWSPEAVKSKLKTIISNPCPPKESKLVSIIVNAGNQVRSTKACIESVIRNTNMPYELVVVNNGRDKNKDAFLGELEQQWALNPESVSPFCRTIKVIRHESQVGYSDAVNSGIEASNGEYLLLLDNTFRFDETFLRRLLSRADVDVRIGIVTLASNRMKRRFVTCRYVSVCLGRDAPNSKYSTANVPCMLLKRMVLDKAIRFDGKLISKKSAQRDLITRVAEAGFLIADDRGCFADEQS